jgi:lipocalin
LVFSSKSFNSIEGRGQLIDRLLGAKLRVTFPTAPEQRPLPAEGNYWVLDTDYDHYAIVWSCEPFNNQSIGKFTFLLSIAAVK